MNDRCEDQEQPTPAEVESTSEADEASRRETLKRFGRLAAYTAPTMAVLLTTSGRSAHGGPIS